MKNPIIVRAIGFATSINCPHAGQYLKTFDHDACDGRGKGTFTPDPMKAKRFATAIKALEFWQKPSRVDPVRQDGKPNRPLTCLTVQLVTLNDALFQETVKEVHPI